MKLADYLSENALTESDFATKSGMSREMINRLKNGRVWPSKDTAEKIFKASKGRVTPNDFLPPSRVRASRAPAHTREGQI